MAALPSIVLDKGGREGGGAAAGEDAKEAGRRKRQVGREEGLCVVLFDIE